MVCDNICYMKSKNSSSYGYAAKNKKLLSVHDTKPFPPEGVAGEFSLPN